MKYSINFYLLLTGQSLPILRMINSGVNNCFAQCVAAEEPNDCTGAEEVAAIWKPPWDAANVGAAAESSGGKYPAGEPSHQPPHSDHTTESRNFYG